MVLDCLALGLNEAGSLIALTENLVPVIARGSAMLAAQTSFLASFEMTNSR